MFTGSDVRIRDPDLPKLHFAVAFKGAAWTDPDSIPLMVIQSLIGAWNKHGMAGARPSRMPQLLARTTYNAVPVRHTHILFLLFFCLRLHVEV